MRLRSNIVKLYLTDKEMEDLEFLKKNNLHSINFIICELIRNKVRQIKMEEK